jgi:hypothetical protein
MKGLELRAIRFKKRIQLPADGFEQGDGRAILSPQV